MLKVKILISCFSILLFSSIVLSDELEDFNNDLQKQQQELLKKTKDIQKLLSANKLSNLSKLSNLKLNPFKLTKNQTQNLQKSIRSQIQTMSPQEISKMIDDFFKSKKIFHKYTASGTKINIFLTKIIKDKDAIYQFISLSSKRDKLKKLGMFSLATIILNFFLKILLKSSSFFIKYLMRYCLLYGIRISLIVFFIGKELKPIWSIFKEVFF